MVLYVHRNIRLIRDGGGWGEAGWGGRKEENMPEELVHALRPVKTEETVSRRQNNTVKDSVLR